ncbi:unnamed protein product [Clonostachys byssicola]|uniref:Uncharacterized protein n=1 Tax=Clonostachys byssicola TaxID=160290 RepID=A0A9N9UBI0_9HYPO|nr:unnamed protein product [Clonostachys byssicola]
MSESTNLSHFVSLPRLPITESESQTSSSPDWFLTLDPAQRQEPKGIIERMMRQADPSPAKAVEEIVSLSAAAAAASEPPNALSYHVAGVIGTIYGLCMSTPPDEQSKLVDFTTLLQQQTVLDPKTGQILTRDDQAFWTSLPEISLLIADHRIAGKNFIAFIAQLGEDKCEWFRDAKIIYEDLVLRFSEEEMSEIGQETVQIACTWLIYAPNQVRGHVQSRTQTRHGQFKNDDWLRLRQILQHSQGVYLDEHTQEMMRCALAAMDKIEVKAANRPINVGSQAQDVRGNTVLNSSG